MIGLQTPYHVLKLRAHMLHSLRLPECEQTGRSIGSSRCVQTHTDTHTRTLASASTAAVHKSAYLFRLGTCLPPPHIHPPMYTLPTMDGYTNVYIDRHNTHTKNRLHTTHTHTRTFNGKQTCCGLIGSRRNRFYIGKYIDRINLESDTPYINFCTRAHECFRAQHGTARVSFVRAE